MSEDSIVRIGFIGLGVMGEPMCRNLIAAERWEVIAWDRRSEPLERLAAAGANVPSGAPALLDGADLVITCLPGGAELRDLHFGADGLIDRVRRGQILVDMSTAPPVLMREIAAAAGERGASFADAPIARTRQAAADGTLAIMVGADRPVYDRLLPVLSAMGSDVACIAVPSAPARPSRS